MRYRAFTLIEFLVVLSIIVLLIAILIPVLSAMRRTHRQPMRHTQSRGIQSALVLYAAGNNTYYPGLTSQAAEARLNDSDEPNGYEVGERFEELLRDQYFTGEYLISPADEKPIWTTGDLTTAQYSYAFLAIDDEEERAEWRDTISGEAIVVSDRAATGTSSADITSVWTTEPGEWWGSIAHNDNSVRFVKTHVGHSTKYGNDLNEKTDDIFTDDNANRGDAIMAYYDDRGVFP